MLQVGQLLLDQVRSIPNRIAIADADSALTYFELNQKANCIANAVKAMGFGKGVKAAILMRNRTEWVVIWYALQKIGVVAVPLHLRQLAIDLAEMVSLSRCDILFYEAQYKETVEMIRAKCGRKLKGIYLDGNDTAGDIAWETLFEDPDFSEAQVELCNDDPAIILHTSGTTGKAKGVVRTQEMVVLHGISLALRNNHPNIVDVMMSTSPLYHIGGFQALIKMHTLGGTFVTQNGIVPKVIIELIHRYSVTQLQMLPPSSYERLYMDPHWRKADFSSVWEVCISAGKCTSEYIDHVFEMFPACHLRPSWGSTEAASITCMQLTKEQITENPDMVNAIGTIMPLMQMRIVDSNGNDVAPGEPGEALVKSPLVIHDYLYDAVPHDEVFVDGNWFRTGDIIRLDSKTNCYYFMDRIKDIIKSGGESIYALEVERIVQKHPAIAECAIVGIPDKRFGEAVTAAIVLMPGANFNQEELLDLCRKYLPSYKKPQHWMLMDSFPKNGVGKVQKQIIRRIAENQFAQTSIK
ncbi:MAG: acyl--CoA ligase [Clostridiales bacterium]|nr:acyl--CoA ligase [Clostridiales bacterium]